MASVTKTPAVTTAVETICNKGCLQVREDIHQLQNGVLLPEVSRLADRERQAVLKELQEIMAVYGDSCRV